MAKKNLKKFRFKVKMKNGLVLTSKKGITPWSEFIENWKTAAGESLPDGSGSKTVIEWIGKMGTIGRKKGRASRGDEDNFDAIAPIPQYLDLADAIGVERNLSEKQLSAVAKLKKYLEDNDNENSNINPQNISFNTVSDFEETEDGKGIATDWKKMYGDYRTPQYRDFRNEYKEGNVPVIPEDWYVKTFSDVGEVRMCRRIFNHETKSSGEVPFFKIGTFGKTPNAFISKEKFDSYRTKFSFPKKGSILISAAGTIGRTIVYDGEDAYFQDSNIIWMNDPWIYREIQPYVHQANKNAGWNFNWDRSESCQFTIYKKGQYYDWHCDSWDKPYVTNDITNGKVRKLSVTVTLTDPKEYKGGELEFDLRNSDPDKKPNLRTCTEILPKGSLVVFPSFVWHRVKPVTKGERNSLVIWNLGYPFK